MCVCACGYACVYDEVVREKERRAVISIECKR